MTGLFVPGIRRARGRRPEPGRRPTVVFVIDSMRLGGAEQHLLRLVRGLRELGTWDVSVYCLLAAGTLLPQFQAAGVQVQGIASPWSKRPTRVLRSFLHLLMFLRRARPDVVHCYLPTAGLVGAGAARLAGVPHVLTTRRAVYWCTGVALLRYRLSALIADRCSDLVVCVAASAAKQAADDGTPPAKLRIVRNGVALPDELGPEVDSVTRSPTVLSVGSLLPNKGHEYLIRAVPLLAARLPDVRLVLVGEGPLRASLEALAAAVGDNRVLFAGEQLNTEPWFRGADVFALPSLSEGMPNAVLEAMGHGLPIVATSVGGVPEAVLDGKNGILVPPRDPAAIAAALFQLFTEDARRLAYGRASRMIAERDFNYSAEILDTEALYRALLTPGGGDAGSMGDHRPLRLLFVLSSYSPRWGGTEIQAHRQAVELVRRGHEVRIVTWLHDASWCRRETLNGVEIVRVPRNSDAWEDRLVAMFRMFFTLWRTGRRSHVMVAHQISVPAHLASWAALLARRPIVAKAASTASCPGSDLQSLAAAGIEGYLRRLGSLPLRRRGIGVAMTGELEADLQRLRFRHIVHIPNGVSVPAIDHDAARAARQRIAKELELPDQTRLVVAAGRFSREKGFDVLIRAWPAVREAVPDARLVFAGAGEHEVELAALISQTESQDSVYLTGFSNNLSPYLLAADVIVIPSRNEGMSNVMLEALAAARPVVSSSVSGAVDLIRDGENGRLVTPGAPAELSPAIIDLLQQPGQLGERARETVAAACDLRKVVSQYEVLYERLSDVRPVKSRYRSLGARPDR